MTLYDIIFNSKKRSDILQLLSICPLNIEQIKYILKDTSVSILPQIKKLIDYNLVINNSGNYHLTIIGKLIVEKTSNFMRSIKTINNNTNFWINFDLNSIPKMFINKIGNIGSFDTLIIDMNNKKNKYSYILKNIMIQSKKLTILTSIDNEEYYKIYQKRANNKLHTKVLTLVPIINKIKKIFNSNYNEKYIHIFQITDIISDEIILMDDYLLILFKNKNYNLDTIYIISSEATSLKFGNEILNYFESISNENINITD